MFIKGKFGFTAQYDDDNESIIYINNGLTITIDHDIEFCRIHHRWELLGTVNLEGIYDDEEKCAGLIIDEIYRKCKLPQ